MSETQELENQLEKILKDKNAAKLPIFKKTLERLKANPSEEEKSNARSVVSLAAFLSF